MSNKMEDNKKENKRIVRWGQVLIFSLILSGIVLFIFHVILGDVYYDRTGPQTVEKEKIELEINDKEMPEISDKEVPGELVEREIIIPGYSDDFIADYTPKHNYNVRSTDEEFIEFVNYLGDDVYFIENANLPPYYTALVRYKVTRGVNTYTDSVQVFRTSKYTGDYSDGYIYYDDDPGLNAPCYIDPTGKYILVSEGEIPEDILIKFLEPVTDKVKITWAEGEFESVDSKDIEDIKNVFHSLHAVLSDKKTDEFEDTLKYEVEFTRFDERKMNYSFTEDGYFIRDNEVYLLEGFDTFIIYLQDHSGHFDF
ncbi:MAG: hypothetical protein MJ172_10175 [Clostridia bacterium]|nr:hypothetical protein [Clostridia bacterium]